MDSSKVEVRASPGKGLGAFSLGPLRRGTRIFSEPRLMYFPTTTTPTDDEVAKAFNKLSNEDKRKFLDLSTQSGSDNSQFKAIFHNNSFQDEIGCELFADISKINHSCIPNAVTMWNEEIQKETVHLIRNISTGIEIIISYVPIDMTIEERRAMILNSWNFSCDCHACQTHSEFGRESDTRRRIIKPLWYKLKKYQPIEMNEIGMFVRLMKDEGLYKELSSAYSEASIMLSTEGNFDQALAFAEKELKVVRNCCGNDSQSVKERASYVPTPMEQMLTSTFSSSRGLTSWKKNWKVNTHIWKCNNQSIASSCRPTFNWRPDNLYILDNNSAKGTMLERASSF
jgi:hypothetical protein